MSTASLGSTATPMPSTEMSTELISESRPLHRSVSVASFLSQISYASAPAGDVFASTLPKSEEKLVQKKKKRAAEEEEERSGSKASQSGSRAGSKMTPAPV